MSTANHSGAALTDWFPPGVLPVRPGPYLREYHPHMPENTWMNDSPDFFDGKHWYYGGVDGGYDPNPELGPPVLRWRGLAEPPLTDWFDPDTPPVREGVYEIEGDDDERLFAHWTPGRDWGFTYIARSAKSKEAVKLAVYNAHRTRGMGGDFAPKRRWRGLAVQP